MRNLIIFGGTFDPPHNGHINTAINVQKHFNFDRFLFLPCKTPVLKNEATATPIQRIDMLNLALAAVDKTLNFQIDLSEINRDTPSYMVDSLQHFRKQFGEQIVLTLLMGADAFSQLPYWHDWTKLLTLANILVIKRAGFDDRAHSDSIKELLIKHETQNSTAICEQSYGAIYHFDAGSFDFSSTWVRKELSKKKDLSSFIPESVMQYIKQKGLY